MNKYLLVLCFVFISLPSSIKAEENKIDFDKIETSIAQINVEINQLNIDSTQIDLTLQILEKQLKSISKKILNDNELKKLADFSSQKLAKIQDKSISEISWKNLVYIYYYLGVTFRGNGYKVYALENFENVLKILNDKNILGTEKLYSATYLKAGMIYYLHKNFEKSLIYLKHSENIAMNNIEKDSIAKNTSYATKVFNANFEKINALKRRENDSDLEEIAKIYTKTSQIIKDKLDNDIEKTIKLDANTLTKILRHQGKYELALSIYKEAADYYQKNNEWMELFDIYFAIANGIYYEQENYNKANLYLEKAMQIAESKNLNLKKYSKDLNIEKLKGDLALKTNKHELALKHFQQVLNLSIPDFQQKDYFKNPTINQIIADPYILRTLRKKGQSFVSIFKEKQNQPTDTLFLTSALEAYELSFETSKKMRQQFTFEESNLYMSEFSYQLFEEAIEICILLAEHTNNTDFYNKKALKISEKGRLNTFRQMIKEKVANKSLPDSLAEKEKTIKFKLRKYFNLNKETQDSIYSDSLVIFQAKLEKFIEDLEKNHPNYHKLKYSLDTLNIGLIQNKLDVNSAIVEYFYGEKYIYIFCLSKENLHIKTIQKTQSITESIEAYILYLQDPKSNPPKNGYKLYEQLLGTVIETLPTINHLHIIPDGKLHLLPFEALQTNKTSESFFITEFNKIISYASSINLLFKTEQKSGDNSSNFVAFKPKYKDEKKLKKNNQQIDALNKYFDGKVYENEQATSDVFLKLNKDIQIIHFGGHGKANLENPANSHLLFSDGLLFANEIYNLELNTNLVVLAACETAKGKQFKGEGILNLSRAFQYANTRGLVVNLWTAYDDISGKILTSFYKELSQETPADIALHKAKTNYLKNAQPSLKHPHYWAGMIFTGSTLVFQKKSTNIWSIIIILGIVISIFIIYFKT